MIGDTEDGLQYWRNRFIFCNTHPLLMSQDLGKRSRALLLSPDGCLRRLLKWIQTLSRYFVNPIPLTVLVCFETLQVV